jgi:predicted AAA+ superfamily ATPase
MSKKMLNRLIVSKLEKLAGLFPVIGIIGPRQVGKTTLALEFSKKIDKKVSYFDLESPSDSDKLQNAEIIFSGMYDQCIIIDEIQRMPELFPLLRYLVDKNRIPLRFIILGSASPHIIRNSSESLAGRIAYLELNPFSCLEIKNEISLNIHHFRGGFPNAALAASDENAKLWLDNFISSYIERDLPLLGIDANPSTIRKFWEMLAWQNGNLLNIKTLCSSIGLSSYYINQYLDYMEGAFLIDRLRPFYVNIKKRLVKAPKILIRDSGLLHRLLRIQSHDQLLGTHLLGASWESFVIAQIKTHKPDDIDLYFYRTHAGAEVDLVLAKGMQPIACIEIKYTSTPSSTKSIYSCIEDLQTKKNFIIIPKNDDYPIKENLIACGIDEFLTSHLQNF